MGLPKAAAQQRRHNHRAKQAQGSLVSLFASKDPRCSEPLVGRSSMSADAVIRRLTFGANHEYSDCPGSCICSLSRVRGRRRGQPPDAIQIPVRGCRSRSQLVLYRNSRFRPVCRRCAPTYSGIFTGPGVIGIAAVGNCLDVLSIDSGTGALALVPGSPFGPAALYCAFVAADFSEPLVYAGTGGEQPTTSPPATVVARSLDQTSGALAPVGQAAVPDKLKVTVNFIARTH